MKYLSGLLFGLLLLVSGCKTDDSTSGKDYIVIARTTAPREACQVIGKNDVHDATRSKVFGPDTKAACEKWLADNCNK